jgi:hypothetical protein
MKRHAILFSALLLSACGGNQMASFEIGGGDHSISIIREQAYLGGPWETALIVAEVPRCQRRYPLKGMAADKIRVVVHRPEPGVFILNAGKRWYVAELQSCGFQMYQEPPPEPGEMVGTFQVKDGVLSYLAKPPA